jgi:hypothetical protein
VDERDSSLIILANPHVNMRAWLLEHDYGTWMDYCLLLEVVFSGNKKAKDWARLGAHVSAVC